MLTRNLACRPIEIAVVDESRQLLIRVIKHSLCTEALEFDIFFKSVWPTFGVQLED
jgi:hypothetical protein